MDRRKLLLSLPALALIPSWLRGAEWDTPVPEQVLPPRLKKGDKVAVVAPAGAVWNQERIEEFEEILSQFGFVPVRGKSLTQSNGYLAGSDQDRADELNRLFRDPEIQGIIAMRGGWGCGRILDMLDLEALKANPKVIMGYSDLTSLLNHITDRTGLVTFHGPVGYSSWNEFTTKSFEGIVMEGHPMEQESPADFHQTVFSGGKASGPLVGGNLTVLTSMLGTRFQPDMTGAILFLEETGEEPYRIDRMMWQLEAAGILDCVNGVVFGKCNSCQAEEPDRSFTLEEVLEHYLGGRHYPAWYGAAFGHLRDKWTVPLGVHATLDSSSLTLTLNGSAVS